MARFLTFLPDDIHDRLRHEKIERKLKMPETAVAILREYFDMKDKGLLKK